jgi:hypothetical protein
VDNGQDPGIDPGGPGEVDQCLDDNCCSGNCEQPGSMLCIP